MLRRTIAATFLMTVIASAANAQADSTAPAPTAPPVTITGSIDGYYRFNFNDATVDGTPFPNNFTSFTNSQSSFELGMASVQAAHSFGKASAFVDLGFGRRAEEFNYGDPSHSTLFALKQAYVSYAVSDKLKFTLGKWATHVGYELADAYLNRNYSMDYMFSYGPFSHTGLKADISLGGKSALMFGIANPTDVASTMSPRKFALGQFSTASSSGKFKAYLNYQGSYGGAWGLTQFDLVLLGTVSDKFSVGYNGTVQSVKPEGADGSSWWGSAVYLNFDPTSTFGITLRGEYFDNKKEVVAAPGTSIFDITLSPNIKIGNLTIIPELRMDAAKDEIFYKAADGEMTKSTVSGSLAVTYHF